MRRPALTQPELTGCVPRPSRMATQLISVEPRRPNRRQQAKATTRAKLVQAAGFLFANSGYFDVGIRDVAARMGMSVGAVFAHVVSKADLWTLVIGGRAPDPALAEEVALLEAQRPGWIWSLSGGRGDYRANVSGPGNPLVDHDTTSASGRGATAAEAVRQARIQAERLHPLDPDVGRRSS